MLKAVGLFGRKKSRRPFRDYFTEWFDTLKNTLLPLLRRSMMVSPPSLLGTHVELLHQHFQAYYKSLDLAATDDVAQLLFPDWRNPIEKPFLWLGDLHPYLFTNLLRSFLDNDDDDDEEFTDEFEDKGDAKIAERCKSSQKPWRIETAWKNRPDALMARIEQIECGLRLMVPALAGRARKAQSGFVERVAEEWVKCERRKEGAKVGVGEAVAAQMEEMVGVFLDANRLRRSVLVEIISATNVYQTALFLEGLAQFVVGFRDPDLLRDFDRCSTPLARQARLAI